MGPAGLAFLYVDKESIEELQPDRTGWKNQIWEGAHAEAPTPMDITEKWLTEITGDQAKADKYDSTNPNFLKK